MNEKKKNSADVFDIRRTNCICNADFFSAFDLHVIKADVDLASAFVEPALSTFLFGPHLFRFGFSLGT